MSKFEKVVRLRFKPSAVSGGDEIVNCIAPSVARIQGGMKLANPWFRFYNEAIDDEKLRLLAFEDRWHFVAFLCCKNMGLLEEQSDLSRRKVAVKMGLTVREMEEVVRRLSEVGLLAQETMQPTQWDKRQFKADNSTERVKNWRKNKDMQKCNGDETFQKRPSNSVRIQNTDTDNKTLCASVDTRRDDFENFWSAFDYKKGKEPAWKSWRKIKNYSPDLVEQIIEAARTEASRRPALIEAGRTPKWAQGWLTDKRWEDEEETSYQQPVWMAGAI